jgi:hypothetical protein
VLTHNLHRCRSADHPSILNDGLWNAAKPRAMASGDPALRNPITGIAGCCDRAITGHAAILSRSVMNSRRSRADAVGTPVSSRAPLGGLEIDHSLVVVGCCIGRSADLAIVGRPAANVADHAPCNRHQDNNYATAESRQFHVQRITNTNRPFFFHSGNICGDQVHIGSNLSLDRTAGPTERPSWRLELSSAAVRS